MSLHTISKDEAQRIIEDHFRAHGDPNPHVRINLEDEAALAKNGEVGIFCLDTSTWEIDTLDQRLCRAAVEYHPKGYFMPVIYEEPKTPEPEDGSPRIVGHIIVVTDGQRVVARVNRGWEDAVLELKPTSLRKAEQGEGELAGPADKLAGVFWANCQRLIGHIAVFLRQVDKIDSFCDTSKGEQVMGIDEFASQSKDGRSLSALVVAGL